MAVFVTIMRRKYWTGASQVVLSTQPAHVCLLYTVQ